MSAFDDIAARRAREVAGFSTNPVYLPEITRALRNAARDGAEAELEARRAGVTDDQRQLLDAAETLAEASRPRRSAESMAVWLAFVFIHDRRTRWRLAWRLIAQRPARGRRRA